MLRVELQAGQDLYTEDRRDSPLKSGSLLNYIQHSRNRANG